MIVYIPNFFLRKTGNFESKRPTGDQSYGPIIPDLVIDTATWREWTATVPIKTVTTTKTTSTTSSTTTTSRTTPTTTLTTTTPTTTTPTTIPTTTTARKLLNEGLRALPVETPNIITKNVLAESTCTRFDQYVEKISSALDVSPIDRSVCCPSMHLNLQQYPKVSGTFTRGSKMVNSRPWWRNGAFAIWYDGRNSWRIGSVRNLIQKNYRRAFAASAVKTN